MKLQTRSRPLQFKHIICNASSVILLFSCFLICFSSPLSCSLPVCVCVCVVFIMYKSIKGESERDKFHFVCAGCCCCEFESGQMKLSVLPKAKVMHTALSFVTRLHDIQSICVCVCVRNTMFFTSKVNVSIACTAQAQQSFFISNWYALSIHMQYCQEL